MWANASARQRLSPRRAQALARPGDYASGDTKHGLDRERADVSDEDAAELLAAFDRSGDGALDYNEFMRILQAAKDVAVHESGVRAVTQLERPRAASE